MVNRPWQLLSEMTVRALSELIVAALEKMKLPMAKLLRSEFLLEEHLKLVCLLHLLSVLSFLFYSILYNFYISQRKKN